MIRLNTAQRLALNLDSHIVIDAGAGTGKTSTIVHRVIEHYLCADQRATRILPKPARPSSIERGMVSAPSSDRVKLEDWGGLLPAEVVLLTFTNRAADEMKDRLRRSISRIKPGPIGFDATHRYDPRVRGDGFVEQLLTLLEDAPIGTIDSFLSQLVSPYRGKLGNSFTKDNVSDSSRVLLVETALRTIWRLASDRSRIGDAVDAGIPSRIASEVLSARDRVARHYSGRTSAARVLRTLVGKSVFVDESSRKIFDDRGKVDREKLLNVILSSIEEELVSQQAYRLHNVISKICDCIKECIQSPSDMGWMHETRMASLDELERKGPPSGIWEKLCWMGHVLTCIVSHSTLMAKKMNFFPNMKLPSDNWPSGIRSYAEIKDKALKSRYKSVIKSQKSDLEQIWYDDVGSMVLHYVRTAIMLDDATPPETPDIWESPIVVLPIDIPERMGYPKKKYHFSIDAEIQNLRDLHLLHLGFQGVMKKLKLREEVHDFDDIERLAGDLLLSNCPEVCRTFYHHSVQLELDSINIKSPWKDDHIKRALEAISALEDNRDIAGESANILSAMRRDLESRYLLLKQIRRRFRAFIIDEAQDNSPLQWRLLSRLWGSREIREDDSHNPDTPWEPTICYVGDIKQSIYAFRQAEVTGFLDFAKSLRSINLHEFSSVPELTRKPQLRRANHSRDPRNDHQLTFASATEYSERGGRDLSPWIPFDSTDWDLPALSGKEVNERKQGLVSLQVNYRSEGGLLDIMNEWWEDIFSERHRLLSKGDFYASHQTLHSFPEKRKMPGYVEWICPSESHSKEDPPKDLSKHIDPFGPGPIDRLERQAMLIALRVRSLIEGTKARVKSSEGSWKETTPADLVSPGDITILLPTRVKLRDAIIRNLHDHGISAQADHDGGLLERPAARALEALVQFVARPKSRHNALWVVTSPLIGFNDEQIQQFLSSCEEGEDLLVGLLPHCIDKRQRSLVSRWYDLASSSRLVELLEDTIDRSDLLVAFPDQVSRQDAEQFVEIFRSLSEEVGGDAIVLSDRLRDLRDSYSEALKASPVPPSDAVKVMSIHSSKGLESKVVVLADLFSSRQTNMKNENYSRLIVSPEMFAGHPNPWPTESNKPPRSALWDHVSLLHRARKNAEARRLLYVAATRAEERLIIAGSPKGTQWLEGEGISIPWSYDKNAPQLGQMWLESLRNGSWRRGEKQSPWLLSSNFDSESRLENTGIISINPAELIEDASIGGREKSGMTVIHHPDCFSDSEKEEKQIITPLQRIEIIDRASRSKPISSPQNEHSPLRDLSTRVRVNPSKLPSFFDCPRCHWLEVRAGVEPGIVSKNNEKTEESKSSSLLDPTMIGDIFHRIIEIGIGNPGPGIEGPSTPLPSSWTTKTEDRITSDEIHRIVFNELLPPGEDQKKISEITSIMAKRVSNGKLGDMIRGETIDDLRIEGLRTEMPFHISIPTTFETVTKKKWTPDGDHVLVNIGSTTIDMSGVIDLVLCTVDKNGAPSIRAVDLKTSEANYLKSEPDQGLLKAMGEHSVAPSCESEYQLLNKHRLQMVLYNIALKTSESDRKNAGLPYRKVLSPAILVGVTGRLIEYPEELLESAEIDLFDTLNRTARMSIASDFPLSELGEYNKGTNSKCQFCSFSEGIMSKSP